MNYLNLCIVHKQEKNCSHYAGHNCDYCILQAENKKLLEQINELKKVESKSLYKAETIDRILRAEKARVKYWKSIIADAKELIREAQDLFEGVRIGEYKVDSFTSQPYRIFLERF